MKITLMIEGSASTIAAILANLPDDAEVVPAAPESHAMSMMQPHIEPSTPIGAGTPVAPASPPSVPNLAAPTPPVASPPTLPISTTSPADDDDDGSVPVDKSGLPWDARIHAGNQATKADGCWKRKKGVGDELVAAVEAELRGGAPTPPPVATPPAPPMTAPVAAPEAPAPVTMVTLPINPPAPVPMPEPVQMAAPAVAASPLAGVAPDPASVDFMTFLQHIGTSGKVDPDYLADLTTRTAAAWNKSLAAITDIGTQPEMIPWVAQTMAAEGRW